MKRVQHREIPPDLVPHMEETFRRKICELLGFPLSRLRSVKMWDPNIDGRSGLALDFQPDLNEAETSRLKAIMATLSANGGGRPPIYPAKA